MSMGKDEEEGQKVMVIQDACRKFSSNAAMGIGRVLRDCSLKSGDELKLLAVLHQVNNPSMYGFMGAPIMGHRQQVDQSSMIGGVNDNMVEKESAMKMEEYTSNERILEILKLCEFKKIKFRVEVQAGPSPKKVALEVAKSYNPTWIILDRHMKKDKRFFMERLSCRISRIKRDNTIQELRGAWALGLASASPTEEDAKSTSSSLPRRASASQFSYAEMIPGSPEDQLSPLKNETEGDDDQLFEPQQWRHSYRKPASLCKSSSSGNRNELQWSTLSCKEEAISRIEPKGISRERDLSSSPIFISEDFKISACSVCHIRRPNVGCKRDFSYAELHAATNGFSEHNFISEGGFGSVYRGEIDGIRIAVKQHKLASSQGEKEFRSEVNVLSKVRHENLVMLLGTCTGATHRLLLVYEYVCHGSLEKYLSRTAGRCLSWEKRMKIARGVARGLQYLHANNIIHRDMRPNNILITHDYESRLGDFGLARNQHEDSSETRVVGTLGYMAPEYAEFGKASTKSDVYAFGVVLLQLITGLRITDMIGEGKSLVGWARPLLEERNYPDLIDPRIADAHDFYQLFWMVHAVEKCLSKDPHKRITMDKVVEYLNHVMNDDSICVTRNLSPAESCTPTIESQGESPSPISAKNTCPPARTNLAGSHSEILL